MLMTAKDFHSGALPCPPVQKNLTVILTDTQHDMQICGIYQADNSRQWSETFRYIVGPNNRLNQNMID